MINNNDLDRFYSFLDARGLTNTFNSFFRNDAHKDAYLGITAVEDWILATPIDNVEPSDEITMFYSARKDWERACWMEAQADQSDAIPVANRTKRTHYHVEIVPGVWVDVYDVLEAFPVTNPAYQHLIKKALKPEDRGHKDLMTDAQDIIDSAIRGKELIEGGRIISRKSFEEAFPVPPGAEYSDEGNNYVSCLSFEEPITEYNDIWTRWQRALSID